MRGVCNHVGKQVAPFAVLVRRSDLFKFRFVCFFKQLAPLRHDRIEPHRFGLPVLGLALVKGLIVVGDLVFVIVSLEPLEICVGVVIEMVDNLADRVVRTFRFPLGLFGRDAVDRVFRCDESTIRVEAGCKLVK